VGVKACFDKIASTAVPSKNKAIVYQVAPLHVHRVPVIKDNYVGPIDKYLKWDDRFRGAVRSRRWPSAV